MQSLYIPVSSLECVLYGHQGLLIENLLSETKLFGAYKTKQKKDVAERTKAIMLPKLQEEYDLYNFARQHFDQILTKLK